MKIISKTVGVVFSVSLFSASVTVLADSNTPNFDSATGMLTIPVVSLNDKDLYKDVQLKFDFESNQFTLFRATPTLNSVEPIDEAEPNDSSGAAQKLSGIGANRPVEASIGTVEDVDYYAFNAAAGRTYVVELFDVANNLILAGDEHKCKRYNTYKGIFPIIYDPAKNEIKRQCQPNGVGNVHTAFTFLAGMAGTYYIRIVAHGNSVLGTYSLRILPKYDEPDAVWNLDTFEPNNRFANAYPLEIGSTKALSTEILARKSQFATVSGDIDSYRIRAKAGETFIVELFDVANNLILTGDEHKCKRYNTYKGIFPIVYDPVYNEITRQCESNGKGDIHIFTTFTAGIDGTYIIRVVPHGNSVSGTYSIRVLKQKI